jgi:hypothetical protein
MEGGEVGRDLLSHDYRKRTLQNYIKLKETSVLVPKPKPLIKDVD